MDRDRSAHLRGDGARVTFPPERACRGAARRRRDLHALARRPLRRGGRRHHGVGRGGGPHGDPGPRRLLARGRERERAGGVDHEPAGDLHVRRRAAQGRERPSRRRAGQDHVRRHGVGDRPHRLDHGYGEHAHDRRRGDRVPTHARHRGARGDELLLSAVPRAVHGRELLAQPAQRLHAARCAGARRERLGALHRRVDRAVPRSDRHGVHESPLARVRDRCVSRVPREATRHVSVPPRPDAAARESRRDDDRDRRAARAPAVARVGVVLTRLLRHRQPRRQGRVPEVLRILRRQPRELAPAPSGGVVTAVRRIHGWRRRGTRTRSG